jgi:hypothetical protein
MRTTSRLTNHAEATINTAPTGAHAPTARRGEVTKAECSRVRHCCLPSHRGVSESYQNGRGQIRANRSRLQWSARRPRAMPATARRAEPCLRHKPAWLSPHESVLSKRRMLGAMRSRPEQLDVCRIRPPARSALKALLEAQGFRLPLRPLARLAQDEEAGFAECLQSWPEWLSKNASFSSRECDLAHASPPGSSLRLE